VIRIASRSAAWRHVCLTLAALALVMKVLVPPGFMAAPQADGSHFPLVLCTGHGAVTLEAGGVLPDGGPSKKAPGEKSSHDTPCVFAGHGAGAPPQSLLDPAPAEFAAYRSAAPRQPRRDISPGRGLAAPPLPARGPPSLLT
jgi:hypothetical protein